MEKKKSSLTEERVGIDNYILASSLNLKQSLENANNQVGKLKSLKSWNKKSFSPTPPKKTNKTKQKKQKKKTKKTKQKKKKKTKKKKTTNKNKQKTKKQKKQQQTNKIKKTKKTKKQQQQQKKKKKKKKKKKNKIKNTPFCSLITGYFYFRWLHDMSLPTSTFVCIYTARRYYYFAEKHYRMLFPKTLICSRKCISAFKTAQCISNYQI